VTTASAYSGAVRFHVSQQYCQEGTAYAGYLYILSSTYEAAQCLGAPTLGQESRTGLSMRYSLPEVSLRTANTEILLIYKNSVRTSQ
jgi:hypothetical protein